MDAKPDACVKELPNGRFDVPATAEPDPYPSAVHPGNALYVLFADQDNVGVPNDERPSFRDNDHWLELVTRLERQVSEESVGRRWSEIAESVIDFSD